jgi:hypothetical protein
MSNVDLGFRVLRKAPEVFVRFDIRNSVQGLGWGKIIDDHQKRGQKQKQKDRDGDRKAKKVAKRPAKIRAANNESSSSSNSDDDDESDKAPKPKIKPRKVTGKA